MNRYTLRLYKSKKCNMKCSYCNIDYNNSNLELNNKEIIEFILNDENYYNIDKRNIYLYGGEPTIVYDDDILQFIKKHFYKCTIITNFLDKVNIQRIVNIFGNKVRFEVSLNKNEVVKSNIEEFKNYINELHLVLTESSINDLLDWVNFAYDIGIQLRISPELTTSEYLYDLSKLNVIMNVVFRNHKEYILSNYHDVRKGSPVKSYSECLDSNIVISNSGNIYSCEYFSDIYKYDNENKLGHISNFSLSSYNPVHVDCDHCISKDNTNFDKYKINQFNIWFDKFVKEFDYILIPEIVLLFLTEQCNLRCEYCFEKDKKNTGKIMSDEIITKYITYAYENSTEERPINILMFGGEPTLVLNKIKFIGNLYSDLKNSSIKPGYLTFTINTNLIDMTDETLNTLVWFGNLVKYFDISVSLDGCKAMQDRRSKDTYQTVLHNVATLRNSLELPKPDCSRVGSSITISKSSTMLKEDYHMLYESVINMLEERELFDMFTIGYAVDCDDNKSNYEVASNMFNCYKTIINIINDSKSLFDKETRDLISEYLDPINIYSYIGEPKPDCGAFSYYLTVKSDGDIIPCHSCFGLEEPCFFKPNLISEDGRIHISYNDTAFHFYNKFINEFNRGYIDIMSEYTGDSCRNCNYFNLCKCIKNSKLIDKDTLMRWENDCMRTLEQADIFLDFLKLEHESQLKELQDVEFKKMTALDTGMRQLCETQSVIIQIVDTLTNGESE